MLCFIDTEFSDFINTELISIGAVTEDGREFYAEVTDYNRKLESGFVKAHIVPLLGQDIPGSLRGKKSEIAARFGEWVEGLGDPIEIGIDYITDWDLAVDLLDCIWPTNLSTSPLNIYNDLQKRCVQKGAVRSLDDVMLDTPPVHTLIKESKDLFNKVFLKHFEDRANISGYIQHHALFDARANRDGWIAAVEHIRGS